MRRTGDAEVAVEVQADGEVPAAAAARAVELLRRTAATTGRPVRYAAVVLSVDTEWPGHRRSQIEATLETVGLRVRGFAAGVTFAEALEELSRVLRCRLDQAGERLRFERREPARRGAFGMSPGGGTVPARRGTTIHETPPSQEGR